MQSVAKTSVQPASSRQPLLLRLFAWLLRADAAYREARRLASAPQHLLDDMGISRSEADAEFLHRFRDRDLLHPMPFGW